MRDRPVADVILKGPKNIKRFVLAMQRHHPIGKMTEVALRIQRT